MTAGSYAGGTVGFPFGLGFGLYIDNQGRAYPQLYGGTPGFSLSGGYTPDLEGLLAGPSASWSPGIGSVRYNVGWNTDTIGTGIGTASVGNPSVGVTHGFGPLKPSTDYSKPWMTPAIRDSAARSYAGIWVTGRSGGVGFWQFDYFDSVLESDTSDDLRQLICAFQPSPGFRCGAN